MSASLQPHGLQHTRLPCPSLSPGVWSNSCQLIQWCHPTISSSSAPSPFPFNLSQHQGFIQWFGSSHQVLKYRSFSISPSSEYWGLISFRDWLLWSPCCPRDPQQSSPAPQFESISVVDPSFKCEFLFFWNCVWAKWNTCASQTRPGPLAVANVRLFLWIQSHGTVEQLQLLVVRLWPLNFYN